MKCQQTRLGLCSTGRNLGEDGTAQHFQPHTRDLDKEMGKLFIWLWAFFLPFGLIFTGFFNLNTPWLPWLLQEELFLLPGDSGTADRLAPASPWLFVSCCPSHLSRDLTIPQQLCQCSLHGEAQHRNMLRQHPPSNVEQLHLPSSF